jgi:hypothetical protein
MGLTNWRLRLLLLHLRRILLPVAPRFSAGPSLDRQIATHLDLLEVAPRSRSVDQHGSRGDGKHTGTSLTGQ